MDRCSLQHTYVDVPLFSRWQDAERWLLLAVCSPSCQNLGTCIGMCLRRYADSGFGEIKTWTLILAPNNCSCQAGYNGTVCQTRKSSLHQSWLAPKFSSFFSAICPQTCYNGGTCIAPAQCNCTSSWSGVVCNIPRCNPVCSNTGKTQIHAIFFPLHLIYRWEMLKSFSASKNSPPTFA